MDPQINTTRIETACRGCGLVLPERDTPAHEYIGASPACWALYGEVLARAYGDPAYGRVLQLIVDTYAVQHPGEPSRRAAQSVSLHLVTLCLVVERGADPRDGREIHRRLVAHAPFEWLEPPSERGRLTIADVEHERAVYDWARDVWNAWEPQHARVHALIARLLG